MVQFMDEIAAIRAKFITEEFEFSQHAVDQSIRRRISVVEVREAIASGTVIEDYPSDKYGASCLILGLTSAARPLHVHCSYALRPLVKVITMYEPDPARWVDFRLRRT